MFTAKASVAAGILQFEFYILQPISDSLLSASTFSHL